MNGQALASTQLALGSGSKTALRRRLKAVDRLLGSASFAAEHLDVYRNSNSKKQSAAAREPWLLSCSIGLKHLSAETIVSRYAQRMSIKQSFRDTKNVRLGQGLTRSMSHGQRRLEALLLIGHIAAITKRLIGETAQSMQLQLELISRKYARHHERAEISVMTLASHVIANPQLMQRIGSPLDYLHCLRSQAANAINPRYSPS